jgi:hypothetical protein
MRALDGVGELPGVLDQLSPAEMSRRRRRGGGLTSPNTGCAQANYDGNHYADDAPVNRMFDAVSGHSFLLLFHQPETNR